MDDGGSSACSIILFLALLAIQAILTGFKKAIDLMNESEIIRRAEEEKDKKSILLNKIIIRATIYLNSIQMVQSLIGLVMGCFFLPRLTAFFRAWLSGISLFAGMGEGLVTLLALIIAVL